MRDIKVASRYAKSLLSIAVENNELETVYKDMLLVGETCSESKELTLLLKSPIIKPDKKEAIVAEVFKGVSKITTSFMAIVIRKKREGILGDIAYSFIEAYKVHKNIKTAQVTTAVALSEDQRNKIVALIKADGNGDVELHEVVDESIIGGVVLRIGDTQIDESLKRKLNNLEMEFSNNPYVKEF